ncbi:hypothetical protein AWB71_05507 [Caballeronia peredens]|nr:hypothetical protein AWB71_05507 [Caballeronia peredens]
MHSNFKQQDTSHGEYFLQLAARHASTKQPGVDYLAQRSMRDSLNV